MEIYMPKNSRPLTAQEEIYWRLTYNDQIHPILAAEIKGDTTVAQWQMALNAVQRRHPLLQVAIEMPSAGNKHSLPTFVPRQDAIIPLRLVRGGGERKIEEEIEYELTTPFFSGEAPLARGTLLCSPERSVFILAISHSIADGISAMFLIHDILAAAAGQSLEALPMPPSAEELLGVVPVGPNQPAIEVNNVSANAGRKPTVRLRSLSVEATRQLIAAARAHSSTVHGALAAAFVLAMRKQAPHFYTAPVRMISPVNTRNELGAGNVLGLYFTSPQSSFEPVSTKDFWDIASQAQADTAGSSNRSALLEVTSIMQSLIKAGLSNPGAAALLKGAFAMDILLTNLGRTPYASDFGDLTLETLWGPAVLPGLDETQAVGVVTTNDRLCLTLTSRDPIPQLLDSAVDILTNQWKL
jgi:hypothetical protein